jgi:hypothetical protein
MQTISLPDNSFPYLSTTSHYSHLYYIQSFVTPTPDVSELLATPIYVYSCPVSSVLRKNLSASMEYRGNIATASCALFGYLVLTIVFLDIHPCSS